MFLASKQCSRLVQRTVSLDYDGIQISGHEVEQCSSNSHSSEGELHLFRLPVGCLSVGLSSVPRLLVLRKGSGTAKGGVGWVREPERVRSKKGVEARTS